MGAEASKMFSTRPPFCFPPTILIHLLLPLKYKIFYQNCQQVWPRNVFQILPMPYDRFGYMRQPWTLLLLLFLPVLWLFSDNLREFLWQRVLIDFFLSSLRVIVTESITNSRNIILCVGIWIDFSEWIANPSFVRSSAGAEMLLKQISNVCPNNSESSIYFTNK